MTGGSPSSMPASKTVPPLKLSCQSVTLSLGVGGLERGHQGDAGLAGNDLEGRGQHPLVGVPIQIDLDRVERHRKFRRIAVDDLSRARSDLAAQIGRQAVAAEFALQFAAQRQVRAVVQVFQPQCQQDVGGRDLVGLDIHGPHAVGGRPPLPHAATSPAGPSSARLSATPPPVGRRRLSEMFWKFHLLPRCWSSTIRLPFFKPISLRFCPSRAGQAQAVEPVEPCQQSGLGAVGGRCGSGGLVRLLRRSRPRSARPGAETWAEGPRPSSRRRRWRAAGRCRR